MPSRRDPTLAIRLPAELREAIDAQRGDVARSTYVYRVLYRSLLGRTPGRDKPGPAPRKRAAARRIPVDPPVVRAWHRTATLERTRTQAAVPPSPAAAEPVTVKTEHNGSLRLSWPFEYVRRYRLQEIAKAHGAFYDGGGGWLLPNGDKEAVIGALRARVVDTDGADAPTVVDGDQPAEPSRPGDHLSVVVLPVDRDAWVVHVRIHANSTPDRATYSAITRAVEAVLPSTSVPVGTTVEDLAAVESVVVSSYAMRTAVATAREHGLTVRVERPLRETRDAWRREPIRVTRDEVGIRASITANPRNPRHRIVLQELTPRLVHGAAVDVLDEHLESRRAQLEAVAPVEIHAPQDERAPVVSYERLPGWLTPAAGGGTLYEHQRAAVQHIVRYQAAALIGDEMGTGKTASAIAGMHAVAARRIAVVCPSVAQSVWRREIAAWSVPGDDTPVTMITDTAGRGVELGERGWVVVSYDQVTPVTGTVYIPAGIDEATVNELTDLAKTRASNGAQPVTLKAPRKDGKRRLVIQPPIACGGKTAHIEHLRELAPHLPEPAAEQLVRTLDRLEGPVLQMLEAWRPDVVIVDEAHRCKNPDALRTRAVRRLAQTAGSTLALTGTPIRNRAEEGGALIELIRSGLMHHVTEIIRGPSSARRAAADPGTAAVRRILGSLMIRRRKADVLAHLPPKVRTHHAVPLDEPTTATMNAALEEARQAEREADVFAALSRARQAIGKAKIEEAADLARDAVAEDKSLVVFAHHKEVINGIHARLRKACRAAVLTGDTPHRERTRLQEQFQSGELDALVISTMAGGEAITLTAAETCIVAELDWTPGNLVQAEDRLHRAGQEADSVTALYVIGEGGEGDVGLMNTDAWMAGALDRKIQEINATLNEHDGSPLGVRLPASMHAGQSVQQAIAQLFVDTDIHAA